MYPGLTLLLGLSLIVEVLVSIAAAGDCTFTEDCSIAGDGLFLSEWPTGVVIPTVLVFKNEMLESHLFNFVTTYLKLVPTAIFLRCALLLSNVAANLLLTGNLSFSS